MSELKKMCESFSLNQPQTHLQSGNVIFLSNKRELPKLASRLEDVIEKKFGFRPAVILRTASEMRSVVARNPFTGRNDVHPSKFLVTFFASPLPPEKAEALAQITGFPEELYLDGRELYVHFCNGVGPSKMRGVLDRILKNTGTARNWNTVTKLLEIAEAMDKNKDRTGAARAR